MPKKDARIDKRCVTMTTYVTVQGVDGEPFIDKREAKDYVRPDFLDAYVADAKTRWDRVEVSEQPDAGPAGYDGQTHIPDALSHPLAGQTFKATKE